MTEQSAKSLASVLGGDGAFPMPGFRNWDVTLERPDGRFVVIEDCQWTRILTQLLNPNCYAA